MNDYRCLTCGASWSLPLGMSCSDHRPVPVTPEATVIAFKPRTEESA